MKLREIEVDNISKIMRLVGIKDSKGILNYLKKYKDFNDYEIFIGFSRFNTYQDIIDYQISDSKKSILLILGDNNG